MIIVEKVYIDGVEFNRTYSDDNRYVVRDGISYDEALDPSEFNRTYTEGEKKQSNEENEEESLINQYAEAGKILLGEEI